MKKNLNVIQIKGIKGLIMLVMVGCCLVAGFIVFPGWVAMNIWNVLASLVNNAPSIGIIQGVLLWGIIVASYFTFRKERVVVCMKTPQGLNEEELKAVFADIKKQTQDDKIIQAMLKARETELKLNEKEEDNKKRRLNNLRFFYEACLLLSNIFLPNHPRIPPPATAPAISHLFVFGTSLITSLISVTTSFSLHL